jgi:hypothetical protein
MLKPEPVAYSVQADECGCVRFARSGAEARRLGAGEMDLEWEDIFSCRRAPHFDKFAPGPVPDKALWDHGWQFPCSTCERLVCDDSLGKWIAGRAYCEDCTPQPKDFPDDR